LIVDTYGVPQYKEANPAYITIATFPFFFGVMFGDMGHGSILASLSLFLIFAWDIIKVNKVGKAIGQQRYLLFLMGCMATYCGMIYNDFFALQVNFWGSCYAINSPKQLENISLDKSQTWYLNRSPTSCTYPIGLDPGWGIAKANMLTFTNSIKMKLSVIFGVLHMSIGIGMKGTNMIYHRKMLELFTEVIAGFFLLFFLFGWMDVMIIMKFFKTPDIQDCSNMVPELIPGKCMIAGEDICCGEYWNRQVQGIIGLMVTTVFQFGAYDETLVPPQVQLFGDSMRGQFNVCQGLVYTAILLIFVMLCTKPCLVKLQGTSHVQDEIEFQQVN